MFALERSAAGAKGSTAVEARLGGEDVLPAPDDVAGGFAVVDGGGVVDGGACGGAWGAPGGCVEDDGARGGVGVPAGFSVDGGACGGSWGGPGSDSELSPGGATAEGAEGGVALGEVTGGVGGAGAANASPMEALATAIHTAMKRMVRRGRDVVRCRGDPASPVSPLGRTRALDDRELTSRVEITNPREAVNRGVRRVFALQPAAP